MAETHIERKRAIWPWILLALVALALIAWFFFMGSRDADEPAAVVAPVGDAMQPPDAAAGMQAETQPAAPERPQAVSAFLAYVDERDAAEAANLAHDYTSNGLRRLADALTTLAESGTGEGATASAGMLELDGIRERADLMQQDPQSTEHARQAREAFDSVADAMQTLQQNRFPQLADQVGRVQEAASAVDPQRLLLEQTDAVERFFQRSADALRAMTEGRA
jgi:hypothetical protein